MMRSTSDILRRERVDTSLPVLIDLFAATKQTEGRSAKTVTWYRQMLSRFNAFLGSSPLIKDVTLLNARAFVASLQEQTQRWANHPITHAQEGGLSAHTIHGYIRVLKVFGAWLSEEGFVGVNPFLKLKRPKLPQPIIEILTDEEIGTINDSINPMCILGARMYVIVLLLLDTGIRANELLTLKVDDIDMAGEQIKVLGKGNKERLVPFSSTTKKALLRYLTTWRPEPAKEDTGELILAVEGTPLTYDALSHMIKRLGVGAGIPRLRAHLFRHTFAVKYLVNGGDVMTLKRILGHATLDVTLCYMHLAESHVKIQHSKFSPVERLGLKPKRKG